jgi:hypothetical protein
MREGAWVKKKSPGKNTFNGSILRVFVLQKNELFSFFRKRPHTWMGSEDKK